MRGWKVTLSSVATKFTQGKTKVSVIKIWKEDVPKKFSHIMSKYQVTKLNVKPAVWKDIKNCMDDDRILIESDMFKEIVIIIGCSEDVKRIVTQLKTPTEISKRKNKI